MGKKCVWSALALAAALAVAKVNWVAATGNSSLVQASATQMQALQEVTERAKAARDLVQQHPSEEHPGIAKYIDRLIGFAEAGNIENIDELIAALDDAAYATPLLLGVGQDAAVQAQMEIGVDFDTTSWDQDNMVVETAPATGVRTTTMQATGVRVEVQNNQEDKQREAGLAKETVDPASESQNTEDLAGKQLGEELSVKDEQAVELPKTGEVRKAGVAEFMVAGVVVMVVTVGVTLIVIKSKKN